MTQPKFKCKDVVLWARRGRAYNGFQIDGTLREGDERIPEKLRGRGIVYTCESFADCGVYYIPEDELRLSPNQP